MRLLASLLFASALLTGCNALDGQACTLIGCSSGLTVHIADPPPDTFSVSAAVDGVVVRTIECTHGICPPLFFETTADVVTIVVEYGDVTLERTIAPEYETFQPNGPGCPPICLAASVTVTLGE